jgi:alkanesulfonate monooxygenase SsuD/methylene tetrahydromethanopterin reductase-like flavin-dependent oxidoreductase (luciferase family)
VGAGWLREEWLAAGLDPATRGRRLDEALGVVKRLWSEPVVEHHGEFFEFGPVAFEPKPVQKPWPKLHVGGESDAALRRAARAGDGWFGLEHTLESVRERVKRLRALRAEASRAAERFQVTIGARLDGPDDVRRFEDAGVTRIVVSPWRRSPEAVEGLRAFAETFLG